MTTTTLSDRVAHRRPGAPGGHLFRRWSVWTSTGEMAGLAVPLTAVLAGADDLPTALRLVVLIAAGAAEGAVLGWAQTRVLTELLPLDARRAWIARTAAAAAFAWTVGLAPSALGSIDSWRLWWVVVLAVPAGALLLVSIGTAQWTVLRGRVRRAWRWVWWTAAGWSAGLAVFLAVASPLWQPGRATGTTVLIGLLAACGMALTMAAVTGWGLVRLVGAPRAAAGSAATGSAATGSAATGSQTVPPSASGFDGPDQDAAPWELPGEQVAARLGVDPARGLDPTEATVRLTTEGPNEVSTRRPTSLGSSVLGQVRDPLVLVLLAAGALTAVIGDLVDTAVIGLVVAVNTTLGVAQERRALRAVRALAELVAPSARVVRGGRDVWVPTRDLVRGDVLRLAAGDVVGADARLLRAVRLQVDESLLTGESLPADRSARCRSPHSGPVPDRAGMVHAGSTVVRGSGEGVVVATGAGSAVGRVAALVHGSHAPATPLQRRLARLGRQIALAVAVACGLFLASGLLRGLPWETTVVAAVALAVAAVPESLPAVVTLALAAGASRMSRRGAVVRSLPAVETLGSVTLLATDKTGTLTEGAMRADRAWTPLDGESELGGPVPDDVRVLLSAAALCNDADPTGAGAGGVGGSADTETALVRAAQAAGLDVRALREAAPRLSEEPFDAVARRMTTVHRTAGGPITVTKGAPESVLPGVDGAEEALAVAAGWANRGDRVLAVTRDGALLGLLALADPVRPEASAAIASCHAAGIRPVLVTGDHAGTAEAVARAVGIVDARHSVGDNVQARVEPEGKLRSVADWQAAGHVVAMTGDGVNDAPALRAADIGVAMGRRGTEVAKEAADLVLADDSLATVTAAIGEGRRVFDNVRRFVGYGLAGGTAEVLVMLVGPFLGLALPLLPAQVLWVNLLTHGPVGVAMGAEPAAPDVLHRPPRPPTSGVFDRTLARAVGLTAAAVATVCLTVAALGRGGHGPWQTQLFVALATAQLGLALALRPRGAWAAGRGAGWLPTAVIANAALLLAGVYLPLLQELLGTEPLTAAGLAGATLPALAPALGIVALTHLRRRADQDRHG